MVQGGCASAAPATLRQPGNRLVGVLHGCLNNTRVQVRLRTTAGMFGTGLVIDLGIVTIPIGIAVDVAAVGVIAVGVVLAGDGPINLGNNLNTMFAKKTSRRGPKQRASDVPSWARGYKKNPGESTEDAIK